MPIGEIAALWRYPVKSMQGEEITEVAVTVRGLLGDRAYAVLDLDTGLIASAKHPRKWGCLLECRATFAPPPLPGEPLPPVWITLPDGTIVSSAQPDIDRILSLLLGRAVSLITEVLTTPTREADRTPLDAPAAETVIKREAMAMAAPTGTFFDYAPLHLLTTATLNRLGELHPSGRFDVRRFRPNLVITAGTDRPDFVENRWIGSSVRVGPTVRLQVIDPCPRCVVTTLAQDDLPRDPTILRTVAQHNSAASASLAPGVVFPATAGVYARIRSGGIIRRGCTLFPSNSRRS